MAREEKQLLLIDICARLPYGVMCNVFNGKYDEDMKLSPSLLSWGINDIKPYLRPLNTITDTEVSRAIGIITGGVSRWSERDKRWYYIVHDPSIGEIESDFDLDYFAHGYYGIDNMDFLNSHHFDYRGLIEKGLALPAPEGMYEPEK